ncbi:MAG: tetraacyldisaccharide 4'-kinase [Deltaproteobacteria bacterium]|nr:tetraacyldisaccharide 4'-kinase [Deltaproteobacteria bacterium]
MRKVMLAPLSLLSFFYGWAVSARIFLYTHRILKTHSLSGKVVSVGNITLGGTGKTPFVCLLSEMLRAREYRVAILSRGYKGKFQGPFGLVSDGEQILMNWLQAGDEPYLLAEKLKGVPVVIGKERWLSGKYAIEQFQAEVAILDDGFQHLPLKRNLDLVLIDSSSPFGNGYLFPRGVLREPLKQIRRADAIILTKVGQSGNNIKLKENLANILDGRPIFQVDYAPTEIRVWGEKTPLPPEHLKGKKVLAFSGVAKPESFWQSLLNLGAVIVGTKTFPDHHRYGQKDVEKLWEKGAALKVDALVTTEKDLVRMEGFPPGLIPLWALSIQHSFIGNDRLRFEQFFFSRLGLEQ